MLVKEIIEKWRGDFEMTLNGKGGYTLKFTYRGHIFIMEVASTDLDNSLVIFDALKREIMRFFFVE